MRFSKFFGKTLRETPTDVNLTAHQLMIRAGVMRTTGAGAFTYLPLGVRALHRLRSLVLESFPDAHEFSGDPAPLAHEINSYRDLPKIAYRNYVRFIDFYTYHITPFDFREALQQIFAQADLKPATFENGEYAQAFALPHAQGNFTYMRCDSCGYSATKDAAKFVVEECDCEEEILKLEKVGTPNCSTIASLAQFLEIGKCQTLKAVMYKTSDKFIFVIVRGDLEVSEQKILDVLGEGTLRPATADEIKAVGAVPGYASPYGLKVANNVERSTSNEVIVLVDESIHTSRNFAAGANEFGYHFINVNYPRDFKATLVADIAAPIDGLRCGVCHTGYLRELNGIRVASYNPRRTAEAAATYLDAEGKAKEIISSSCRIHLESLLTAIIETHHDEHGIIFPEAVAPYDIHLIKLGKAPATQTAADDLYEVLQAQGKSVLYDDRPESAGVKFADADLIGLPLRITVSDKSLLAGGAEVKRRHSEAKEIVALDKLKT